MQTPRRERKKAAVRAQIVAAAIELFSRRGLAEVTVDEIADAADVGKGTIYNYFATKEDIVVAYMADLEGKVQAQLERFTASTGRLDMVLSEFIRFQFRLKEPYHRFVRVLLAQMFLGTEDFLPYMVEMQKVIDPPIESLFRGLQQRQMLRKDVPIADLGLMFKTIHLGLSAVWAIEGPPFRQSGRLVKQTMKMLCEGLEAKPDGSGGGSSHTTHITKGALA